MNGYLDRETVDSYNLVIEAQDGGTPPKTGVLNVDVNIQERNKCFGGLEKFLGGNF